ncbi:MAG: hypothetical protein GXY36_03900 [Chloroflexi bacterium]|nr:hypothetical protein [Chloroflexota bacterium]
MAKKTLVFVLLVAALVLALALPAAAQDEAATPSVAVSDQVVLDGAVWIESAYSEGPGFVVIHTDGGGAPGPVIGHRALNPGWNYGFTVPIDAAAATPTLFAMLHADTGEVGVYEFGTVEGADGPVRVNDQVVTPSFGASVINAADQVLDGSSLRIASVTVAERAWVVVHSDAGGSPGPVLGQTLVNPGTTANVLVALSGDVTDALWPMLHSDTGAEGEYEFGTVEGADPPIRASNGVATTQVWTVPHMRVDDQIISLGDGMAMGEGAPTLTAKSVLSPGPGWLVVHSEADSGPGPVLGFAPLTDGLNTNVVVELDAANLTPRVWPMLHTDTGVAGTYEFGEVEGADTPVRVNDQVVTFGINAAPALVLSDQTLTDGMLVIDAALIDAPGWIAVHSSQDGGPGPVIASYPLMAGVSRGIRIPVDAAQAGTQVFPMLHYDTGAPGVYEFGTVEGADGPVRVGDAVVVGPINLTAGEEMGEMEPAATEEMMQPSATEAMESMDHGATEEAPAAGDMGGTALDGQTLVMERCTVCHTAERIENAQKTREEWEATVDRMISYGANLNAEERQAVIDYLASR